MDILFIFIGAILAVYFANYIFTLPERHENKEKLKREELLFKEKYEAEKAKQYARIAGQIARERINKIASLK